MTIKATGEDTGGVYSCLTSWPRRVSVRRSMSITGRMSHSVVLEGLVRFRCGDREFVLESGGYVYLPKGVPHAFRVEGSAPAHLMQMILPRASSVSLKRLVSRPPR